MKANKSDNLSEGPSFKDRHSFFLFITGSMLMSVLIVIISMAIYNGSGAAQLDLSRPGYVSVRSQASDGENDFQSYSAIGTIDKKAIDYFKYLYNKQVNKLEAVDAFGGSPSPLSSESLGIDGSATTNL